MPVPKHLDEAVARLKESLVRIDEARAKPATLETVQEWLNALTEYTIAQGDIETFNNESVHEKLHEIAGRVGMAELPPPIARIRSQRPSTKSHGRP